ncbi:uncharacterized protein [Antedon mediterranea]|uniref:uncharacterized protein n=1 Tax=Antedon mediterranea TaxID=105859 RepID=UPI003AF60364
MGHQMWLVLAILTTVITTGSYALTCYSCTSVTESKCGDPFDSAQITTVNCTSSCYKSESKANDVEAVIRGCGVFTTQCAESGGVELCYTVCTTDECNGSMQTAVGSALFIVASGLISLIML